MYRTTRSTDRLRGVLGGLFVWLVAAVPGFPAESYLPDSVDPLADAWRYRAYRDIEGLGVRCMTETPDGVMWFGVDRGVTSYDGYTWKRAAAPSVTVPVRSLLVTSTGQLIAGTREGIYRRTDSAQDQWQKVYPAGSSCCSVHEVHEGQDGRLWLATEWGPISVTAEGNDARLLTSAFFAPCAAQLLSGTEIISLDDTLWPQRPFPSGAGVVTISQTVVAFAPESAARDAGLQVGDRVVRINGSPSPPLNSLQSKSGVTLELELDRQGHLVRRQVTCADTVGSYRRPFATSICEDRQGNLWVGLQQGRVLVRWANAEPDAQWEVFGDQDQVKLGIVPLIREMRDGEIWIVSKTRQGGVNRFDGHRWSHQFLSELGGSNMNTSLIQSADGTVWVGGSYSLQSYRGGRWSVHDSHLFKLPLTQVRLFEKSDGTLWIAGRKQTVVSVAISKGPWSRLPADLRFQCEEPDGTRWYLKGQSAVVREASGRWTRFDQSDGLIERPTQVLLGADGEVWAAGGQAKRAAVALFDGQRWQPQILQNVATALLGRTSFVAADGAIWLSGSTKRGPDDTGGLVRIQNGRAEPVFSQSLPPVAVGIGELPDGQLVVATFNGIHTRRGDTWLPASAGPTAQANCVCLTMGSPGELWVGTKDYGLFRFRQDSVDRFTVDNGLPSNHIQGIATFADGRVVVNTESGPSSFDGIGWRPMWFHEELAGTTLQTDRAGNLWFDQQIRYNWDGEPPETRIRRGEREVLPGGGLVVAWFGIDRWNIAPRQSLHFAWRLNGGPWSRFLPRRERRFSGLRSGDYLLEVVARDRDLNVDLTPASFEFTVLKPVWQRSWFLVGFSMLLVAVTVQTGRVMHRGRSLKTTNRELLLAKGSLASRVEARTRDLTQVNDKLRQEIDERRKIQHERERLIKALEAKNAELERFAYTVSHDLKSPLVTIRGFAGLLRQQLLQGQQQPALEALEEIYAGVDHMHHVLHELLEMAKIGQVANLQDQVSMLEVFQQASQLAVAACAGCDPQIDLAEDLPRVQGDRLRLLEVAQNLLENAVKFSCAGGQPSITVGVLEQDGESVFYVRDNGIGIDKRYQDRIFGLFDQLDPRSDGAGAGLAIVKRIIEVHGGRIWVQSAGLGHGATFYFTLPIASASPTPAEVSSS